QYQHVERRPDLVSVSKQFPLDESYLGTRYLPPGEGVFWARRDLVEVTAIEPSARLLYDERGVRVFASRDTIDKAAPGALFRCELIVQWDVDLVEIHIRGSVPGGDTDEIALAPYQRGKTGIERFALLIGAPDHIGAFDVPLEVIRDGRTSSIG